AADLVGERSPPEPARHVEEAQEADESGRGGGCDPILEHLLDHRGGLPEHTDAGGDVEAEDDPQPPEFRRPERVGPPDLVAGVRSASAGVTLCRVTSARASSGGGDQPSGRHPSAGSRYPNAPAVMNTR